MPIDLNTDFQNDIVNKTYEAIELAKKTGKIKKGANESTKVLERGQAKLIAIAKDVNPKEIIMHFPILCEEKNCILVLVPSRQDLGAAAGISLGTSAVAITDSGDAKDLIAQISKTLKK